MKNYQFIQIASQNLDRDVSIIKELLTDFEKKIHFDDGFRLSSNAQFAMGWWFFSIQVKIEFIEKLVQFEHTMNSRAIDEGHILKKIEEKFKLEGSKARAKLDQGQSLFKKYWVWLLK